PLHPSSIGGLSRRLSLIGFQFPAPKRENPEPRTENRRLKARLGGQKLLEPGAVAQRIEIAVVPRQNPVGLVFVDCLLQVLQRRDGFAALRVAASEEKINAPAAVLLAGVLQVLDGFRNVAPV